MSNGPYKIALVAGEASSDLIGATLINDLFELYPDSETVSYTHLTLPTICSV